MKRMIPVASKPGRPPSNSIAILPRRGFLIRCWEAAAAFLLHACFGKPVPARSTSPPPEFHLHPHYREQTPLDSALLHIEPGPDVFSMEKHHDALAAILNAWSAGQLQSPENTSSLEQALSSSFRGTSWQPLEFHPLRPASKMLDVRRLRFAPQPSLAPEPFLAELRSSYSDFLEVLIAEFQITQIAPISTGIATRVRYELVGIGQHFYREQRTGFWSLDWELAPEGEYRILRWHAEDQVRSRSAQASYADVTKFSFGGNSSYSSQLMYGVDHWRTVLDSACGIDIYGHNGVSVGDIDGDGFDDIYVCQPAGLPNRLYRNRGDGTFEDITESSGVGLLDNTACALVADFDNDGRQDLVVVRASGPLLFLNEGNGKFRLKPGAFQFATPPQGTFTGAAAADYNRDGWLDIYFCLYVFYQGAGQYKYPTPYFAAENGPPNFMMRNNGDATFSDVTAQCGLDRNNTRYSFCCAWSDYNGDGWPDLYVVNDFGRKNLYRNNGDGTFSDVTERTGVEDVGAGMSVCWLDYDNDGFEDLYVANMWTAAGERITAEQSFQKNASKQIQALYRKHAMGNSLFRNDGNSAFRDMTDESNTRMGRWSWSSDYWDFDHDGFSDIYVANGMISGPIRQDLNSFFWRQVIAKSPNTAKQDLDYEHGWNALNELIRADYTWSGYERNLLYANNRDGTFSDVSGALGLDFPEDSRSFALADFDGDGRQEILLKNRNAPQLRLMKNAVSDLPPAMAFHLLGTKSNRDAIGATVTLETSAGRQTKLLQAGSGFLSQHSKDLFFGLGDAKGDPSATIRWPSGHIQRLKELPLNHRVFVTEGLEAPRVEPFLRRLPEENAAIHSTQNGLSGTLETWLLIPISAPDFSLVDVFGKSWTLSALRGIPVLVCFWKLAPAGSLEDLEMFDRLQRNEMRGKLQILIINLDQDQLPHFSFPTLRASEDVSSVYNLLFRYLFDRHRDLAIPSSFLIDERGQITKVYQGKVAAQIIEKDIALLQSSDAGRLSRALPFPGVSNTFEFGRNYLSLGSIFFQRGYVASAEDFFASALKEDPSSAEAFYGLGSVYLKQQNNGPAREYFDKATKVKAAYPETTQNAWNNLGLLAAREGDTTGAIACFQQALQLDPDYFIALQNLGNAYRQQKRWEDARKTLERALAINPGDPEANYSLGMVFAQTDDLVRANERLRNALQARPAYPEALNNLGVLYLRNHRRDDAVVAFQQCIRLAPAFDQSYLNLAKVYEIEGDFGKARDVLLALLKQHPDHLLAQQALEQLH